MNTTPESVSDRVSDPTNGGIPIYSTKSVGWKYELSVAEIEAIIARIEGGEMELAEVFEQFELAVRQLRQCETFLAQRQQQMDVLIETLTDEPSL
jgi:exodeoxyribonuclease VII small subunit